MPLVYKATNTVNDKIYIGKTIETLEKRKDEHYRNAIVYNLQTKFYRAIRKYGFSLFTWETVSEHINNEECLVAEIETIKKYNSLIEGYNMTAGGEGSLGRCLSDESKSKISKSLTTYFCINPKKKGFTHSDATKKLISEKVSRSNRKVRSGPMSEATKLKMREQKQKIIESGSFIPFNTKLTRDQVLLIKYMLQTGAYSQLCIAREFGISDTSVYNINKGITYKNITK
jgi:group I intron endonuclease